MKWNHPQIDDTRTVTKFLLFPKRIGYQTRWLEYATWTEVRTANRRGCHYWWATRWVPE